jgi:U3 small nucleolar ribonucleoprotein protein IMP4
MLRKNIRLRKEYLFNKQKERQDVEKKLQVKKALDEDKSVPFELRKEEATLRHQLENDDASTLVPKSHIDDEYEEAKYKDPKVMITTSRNPSSRLMNFQKVSLEEK